ncbi:MAG: hypothetical protein BZY75_02160 [SAR202 cluster bacterium Io17-Chloro-G7]|nr:MAG: hypothetical protein BZY75_02160 [SAR202 cluster bacterium Io17-Chloro-G7]
MMMELATDQPLDLAASLESGQSHRWERDGDWFSGVLEGAFIKMRQDADGRVEYLCDSHPQSWVEPLLRRYFRLDDDLPAIYSEIKADPRVAEMVDRYPGLRILRIEPWECVISFICSANSNIPRIHQNMEALATNFGDRVFIYSGHDNNGQNLTQSRHAFPTPAQLGEAGEAELRRLGLGFRAPYVDKTTRMVLDGRLDLDHLVNLPYLEAKSSLMECPGIGPKVADCIAVFSLDKLEAFPIDVWIRRALGEWYFAGEKPPPDRVMLEWAQNHFGRYGGYAQQYLFHGMRLRKKVKDVEPEPITG